MLVNRLINITGEGFEEVTSEIINPFIKRAFYDENAQNASLSDMAKAFGGGALVSAILGVANVKGNIEEYNQIIQEQRNKNIKETYNVENNDTDNISLNVPQNQLRDTSVLNQAVNSNVQNKPTEKLQQLISQLPQGTKFNEQDIGLTMDEISFNPDTNAEKTQLLEENKKTINNIANLSQTEYTNSRVAHQALSSYREKISAGEMFSVEHIKNIPQIQEAKKITAITDDEMTINKYPIGQDVNRDLKRQEIADFLCSEENGAAVYENGKLKEVNGKGVYNGEVKQDKIADIVIGPPAAGKSSVFADRLSNEHSARIIDSDIAKEMLPEFNGGYGANAVQEESAYISEILAFSKALEKGDNIVIPKVGKSFNSIVKIAQRLKANGYTVNIYYNELPIEKAINRNFARFIETGRYIPIEYMEGIGNDKIKNVYLQLKESGLIDYYEWKSNDVKFGEEPILREKGHTQTRNNNRENSSPMERGRSEGLEQGVGRTSQENGLESVTQYLAEGYIDGYSKYSNDVEFGERPKLIETSDMVSRNQGNVGGRPSSILGRGISETSRTENTKIKDTSSGVSSSFDDLPNSIGAMKSDPTSYYALTNEHGTIKPGEMPDRVVDVPKKSSDGNIVSNFARTTMEAKATPDGFIDTLEDMIANGDLSHEVVTDKKALHYADTVLNNDGWDGAVSKWDSVVNGKNPPSKEDIALGQMLYNQAINAGDVATASRLVADLCVQATRAGQAVQAFRLLKKMTPSGKLYMIEKSLQGINDDLLKKYKDKYNAIKIPTELTGELLNAKDTQSADLAVEKIEQHIADNIPTTWADKLTAWRYLSMLGNPRTHIRNIVGNTMFMPVKYAKDILGAGLEKAFNIKTKTKSLLTNSKTDKALKNYAELDFNENSKSIKGESKYDIGSSIQDKRKIFNTKILEKARNANLNALEAEDAYFLKNYYINSLAASMKANSITAETASSPKNQDLMTRLKNYAVNEAQKATFRDMNSFTSAVVGLKRAVSKNTAGQIVSEGILPFAKTPANIVARGVEYSPAMLAKALTVDLVKLKQGKITSSQVIDNASSGLTGTAICALGYLLASLGVVSGSNDGDKEDKLNSISGEQQYAINFDGGSYTIDWASPAAMPLFVGVELQKALSDKETSSVLSAIGRITDPVFEMSMLQGINSAIKSTTYSEVNPILAFGTEAVGNYAGQLVPTVLGQTARTIDNTRRQTYVDKNSPVPDFAQRLVQKQQAKIPFLNQNLLPYRDQFGRTQTEDNIAVRAFQNFISPGYISKDKSTEVEKELSKLYKEVGDTQVLPSFAPKKFNVNKETKYLTRKEYDDFSKIRGELAYDQLLEIIQSNVYDNLSSEDKADIIKKVYSYAHDKAKSEVSDYRLEKQSAKIDSNPDKFLIAYGISTGRTRKDDVITQLMKLGYTKFEAGELYKDMK